MNATGLYRQAVADHDVTTDEQQLLDAAARLAIEVIEPLADDWERERRFARESFDAGIAAGLGAILVPTDLGGKGAGEVALARAMEELASADLGAAFSLVVHNNMARGLATSGNQHLIDTVLPRLVSGESVGAFLLTEPGFGSDAASIVCRAERDGDDWVINGEKAWVTNASDAGFLNVYAQSDPSSGHRGIVSIVVDADLPGVRRLEPYELMGVHSLGTGGFTFDNVRVGVENTFVPAGEAFRAAMVGIDLARVLVGAMCTGLMRRSLEVALEATASRQAFGRSIADNQGVQWMLADVATDLEATRLLTYRAARLVQDGDDAVMAAAHAKKFAARKAQERIADCMQLMGAAGYRRDNPLPRHLAAAKLAGYIDGTTEIQNEVIARRLWL